MTIERQESLTHGTSITNPSAAGANPAVLEKLADGARKLLDLSMRNKMIKFRPTKTMHVRLYATSSSDLTVQLAEGESGILLHPNEDRPAIEETWQATEELEVHYNHGEEDPERRIRNLMNEAKTFEGEHGHSALFCAVGFVHWNEVRDTDLLEAPLLLVPVSLSRGPRNKGFQIVGTGDPPIVNPAIQLKLRDQDIVLPHLDLDGDLDLDDYLAKALASFKDETWEIRPTVWLGMFKFHKFVMYQDLVALLDRVRGGQALPGAVESVVDPQAGDPRLDRHEVVSEQDLDERIDWTKARYVLDADPSQIVAIEEVKAGKNLVIQGPPGTGKSQTIANLISELLASNKSVLFVSEKEAALDVVKRRLDATGLGTFSLALHGVKSTHEHFRSQMQPVINGAFTIPSQGNFSADEYQRHRQRLDQYAHLMRSCPKGSDLTIGWAMNTLAAIKQRFPNPVMVGSSSHEAPTKQDLDSARRAFSERREWAENHGAAETHEWAWSRLADSTIISELNSCMQHLTAATSEVDEASATLALVLGQPSPTTWDGLEALTSWKDELQHPHQVPGLADHGDLKQVSEFARECLDSLAEILAAKEALAGRGLDWETSAEAGEIHEAMDNLASKFLFWLRPSYWATRKQAMGLYADWTRKDRHAVIQDLEALAKFQGQAQDHARVRDMAGEFGSDGDWDRLLEAMTALTAWLTHVVAISVATAMPDSIVRALGDPARASDIGNKIDRVNTGWKKVKVLLEDIARMTRPDAPGPFGNLHDGDPGTAKRLVAWYQTARQSVGAWATYQLWCQHTRGLWLTGITSLDPATEGSEQVELAIDYAIAEAILNRAAAEFPELHTFNAENHERAQAEFRRYDSLLVNHARHELVLGLVAQAKRVMEAGHAGTPMATIRTELMKKRRRMPIRKLVQQTLPALRQLKPCFMMSPITVSTYLDPAAEPFDVLIFDEASQVKPEDALVCLMRARQVVVVGDSKQLPPTSFFDSADAEDEDDDVETISDMESILDACVANMFPEKTLRWHYRSRHHTLIEGSNHEFYHNRLLVFHSPQPEATHMGLRHHYFPGSAYGEGGQGVNIREAREIARMVHQHYEEYSRSGNNGDGSRRTLGVVAFSQAQARSIRDAVYELAPNDTEFQVWVDGAGEEPFFIKNLENVQGDERDRILISTGYGRNAQGEIKRNFGPVNKKGGERRLNVLFTRAREQTIVVSNFKAGELNLQGVGSHGPQVLKRFIELAETGIYPQIEEEGGETDSPFEDAVLALLEREGYRVTPQVGCSGYRIDLAVHHPDAPGRYCIAVECDGAAYHSSRVARERDRQRQEVLERMGWRFARVWSTEWYHRPQQAREKLLAAVQAAHAGDVETPTTTDHESISDPEDAPYEIEVDFESGLQFEDYNEADTSDFPYYGNVADINPNTMANLVHRIVQREGPVTIDVVSKRIRDSQDQGRLGSQATAAIQAGIRQATRDGLVVKDPDGGLWIKGNPIRPRLRPAGFPTNGIPGREAMQAWQVLLRNAQEIDVEAGLRALREGFGYARLGKDLETTLRKALDVLAVQRKVSVVGTIVRGAEMTQHSRAPSRLAKTG